MPIGGFLFPEKPVPTKTDGEMEVLKEDIKQRIEERGVLDTRMRAATVMVEPFKKLKTLFCSLPFEEDKRAFDTLILPLEAHIRLMIVEGLHSEDLESKDPDSKMD